MTIDEEIATLVVDLHSLADFHAAIMSRIAAFEERIKPALVTISGGVPFGAAALADMDLAFTSYQTCIDEGRSAVNSFNAATHQFAQAAAEIVKQYEGSDAFAAAQPADVAAALKAAPTLGDPAATPAGGAT